MGNCIQSINDQLAEQTRLDRNIVRKEGKAEVLDILFFPDTALPCHNALKGCRRANCQYSHDPSTNLIQFLNYINLAKVSLDICVFTITCNQISERVIAAHQRGVKVRIITDNAQAKTLGSDIENFRQEGIPVRDDHSTTHMHHKFCIIDKKVLMNGSFNWSRQAVLGNRENVVISTGIATVKFHSYFNDLWKEYGDENRHNQEQYQKGKNVQLVV